MATTKKKPTKKAIAKTKANTKKKRDEKKEQKRVTLMKKALIQAMTDSLGIVTKACKIVGINRCTYYEYYNNDEEFRKECDDIDEVALDFVESKLHKQINDGIPSSTIFYLKTRGKKRGYQETTLVGEDKENKFSSFLSLANAIRGF